MNCVHIILMTVELLNFVYKIFKIQICLDAIHFKSIIFLLKYTWCCIPVLLYQLPRKFDSVFPVNSWPLTPLTKPLFRKASFQLGLNKFAGED